MSLAIAIAVVALALSGYAAYTARWTRLAVVELIDAQEGEEAEPEEGPQELWLSDGEFYSADKAALEAAFPGALGFVQCEGVPSAVMPNGVWSLHKLLTDKPTVRALK